MKIKVIPTGHAYVDANIYLPFNGFKILVSTVLSEVMNDYFIIPEEFSSHLLFFKDGGIDYIFNEETHQIEPSTFVLYSSQHTHTENATNRAIKKYHVIFSLIPRKGGYIEKSMTNYQKESDYISNFFSKDNFFNIIKDNTGKAALIFEQIISEFNTMRFGYNYIICSLMTELFAVLFRNINKFNYPLPQYTEPQTQILLSNSISQYLVENFRTVTLREISRFFHLSERQIQRHIFKLHKISFTQKLNAIRIENSLALLKDKDWPISKIAEEVGFATPARFYNLFKKMQNTTPLQYRKKNSTSK